MLRNAMRSTVAPEADGDPSTPIGRRRFNGTVGAAAAALCGGLPSLAVGEEGETAAPKTGTETPKSESLVATLYETLTDAQKKQICFDWDYVHPKVGKEGPYRTHVNNNWQITQPKVASSFFTAEQQDVIEALFWGLYEKEWHDRLKKQIRDDAGGYGKQQSIAIFGEPGSDKFQFAMTGRHLTIRCDGNSSEHVAFGGPIFYGHAAQGFNEKPDHPGNVYWPQAQRANALYQMLDGKQRELALLKSMPFEWDVHFEGKEGKFDGIPVSELSADQKTHLQGTLELLLEPYRKNDRDEALACLREQGGLDGCHLAFYQEGDVGNDGVWDNWRLEGPAFVWYFRGSPHVHVWANVSADPSVKITAG